MGQKIVRPGARGRRIRTIVLAVCIPLVVVAGLYVAYLAISANSAEDTVTPIARSLTSVGGKETCDTGDGGHTGLNNAPWYAVYYSVPDEPRARAVFLKAAAAAGFALHPEKLPPGTAETYGLASSPPSESDGLYLSVFQHQVFFPGDCGSDADKKTRISGSQAVFEITFYGKPNK